MTGRRVKKNNSASSSTPKVEVETEGGEPAPDTAKPKARRNHHSTVPGAIESARSATRARKARLDEIDSLLGLGSGDQADSVPDIDRAVGAASAQAIRELVRVVSRAVPATAAQRQAAAAALISYADRRAGKQSRAPKYLSDAEIAALVARKGDLLAARVIPTSRLIE